jgi:hypothetical protein
MKKMKRNQWAIGVIGLSIIFMLLSTLACSTSGAPQMTASPSITVDGSGMPGKAMEIKGQGFVPGETIELVLDMDSVPIIVGKKGAVIKVDEKGSFLAQTNYPHKLVAVAGAWDLIATGDKGSQASCKVEIKQP